MKFRQQLIQDTPYKFGRANKRTHITIHETGNPNAGANAAAHASLQSRGNHGAQATWHYQVDDVEAVQSYTHDFQLWHAGDGRGNGNLHSIGIEICVNADGNYRQAVANAVALVQKIQREETSAKTIVQHNHWSGKNCPTGLRANNGRLWNQFLSDVRGNYTPPTPSGKLTTDQVAREIVYGRGGKGNPWGNGQARIDALRKAGYDPVAVQQRVNQLLAPAPPARPSVDAVAREIVYGRGGKGNPWGNGQARIDALRKAGYDPVAVQQRVNQLLGW